LSGNQVLTAHVHYISSTYIFGVPAATLGGGTSFGAARECLETLGSYKNGKAETIASTGNGWRN
jgi:hypothetical protein